MRLENKVVVICGVGKGMSRAMALLFAREGAAVVMAARKREVLEQTAQAIIAAGGRALAKVVDMQDEAAVAGLYEAAVAEFGRIDAVCLLPGGFYSHMNDLPTIEPEFFAMVQQNHVNTTFWGARHAIPHLKAAGGGAIITISAGYKTRRDANIAYATAKEAILGFSKNLAREMQPHNIRVNTISPGLIRMPLEGDSVDLPITSLDRPGQPADIAYAALYLVSDESPWLTGQNLVIDGGDEIYAGKPRP